MSSFAFGTLRHEYEGWLGSFHETKQGLVAARARFILPIIQHYKAVANRTGVPAVWLAATQERESSSHIDTYFGNGDHVIGDYAMAHHIRTHNVPRNRGPFPTWDAGAIDALHLDGMDQVATGPIGWIPAMALYQWEKWNGFGYRNHGKRTPYVVGATSLQQPGRYAGDGNWTLQWDTQYGTLPIAIELIKLDPTLDLTPSLLHYTSMSSDPILLPPTQPTPDDFAAGTTLWTQHALNQIDHAGLVEDGAYGKNTRRAIQIFQGEHDLTKDGIVGPLTRAAIKLELTPPAVAA